MVVSGRCRPLVAESLYSIQSAGMRLGDKRFAVRLRTLRLRKELTPDALPSARDAAG